MKDRQWYAARMTEDLKPFKKSEIVYIRRALFKEPLAVGEVFILFNPKLGKSVRVAASYGRVWTLWPNSINPKPAPKEKNDQIQLNYVEYLDENPLAKRRKRTSIKMEPKGSRLARRN